MTLEELPAAFAEARALASASAHYTASAVPPDTCRYCAKPMVRWPSRLADGHSLCLAGVAFQQAVYDLWLRDPAASQQRIAELCNVGLSTVRSWLRNVETRPGRVARSPGVHHG